MSSRPGAATTGKMASSFFAGIDVAPPIEVFHMNKLFMDETDPKKVNLTVGAYRTAEGKPYVLPVVREAERRLAADDTQNHEYLPVLGYEPFAQAATALLLGQNHPAIAQGRAIGVQCLSGTGSLRMGAEFLHRVLKYDTIYMSKPTWGNHKLVFKNAGFTTLAEYRYWDAANRRVDIDGMLADLRAAPAKSVVLLHGCAHNPTGMDPTQEQWKQIQQVIKEKGLFTFFDIAYQGFASGNPDQDAWAVRHFAEQGTELLAAQSFAKNFGLYNERIGNVTIVTSDPATFAGVRSQMSLIIRANWSNPPNHGAKLVHMILTNADMKQQWFDCIQQMSSRIKDMRAQLRSNLESLGTPGKWDHITQQIGMFSYTGLTAEQVDHLVKKHKVFLLKDGRINVCGLNPNNVAYVAQAFDETIKNVPSKV